MRLPIRSVTHVSTVELALAKLILERCRMHTGPLLVVTRLRGGRHVHLGITKSPLVTSSLARSCRRCSCGLTLVESVESLGLLVQRLPRSVLFNHL